MFSFVMYRLLLICSIFINILYIPNVIMEKIEVKVKQGVIKGTRHSTILEDRLYYAFYGVPYAEAPVKELRFKNPKLIKKWQGIFDASIEYHGACAQSHVVHKQGLYGVEDCLYLNIFTPTLPRNVRDVSKTVMVWFHGHAFTSGFSHLHGPDFLIDNDVVLVTANYRLGVFGFLSSVDNNGDYNMGIKDIRLALKWIKINIKKFGGDPEKVTVMGSDSAGTLLSLLFTNRSKLLFSKIILQSGSLFSPSMYYRNFKKETEILLMELSKKSIKELNEIPTAELIGASLKIYNSKDMINFQRPVIQFTPFINKNIQRSIIKNMTIPMLIGFNSQESISEIIPFLQNPRLLKGFEHHFKYMVPFFDGCKYNYTSIVYRKVAEEIKKEYFKNTINEMSINEFTKYISDLHVYPTYSFIKNYLDSIERSAFVYKFNYRGQFNAVKGVSTAEINMKVKGAAKGDEICYILRCEPLHRTYVKFRTESENRTGDIKFIKDITKMWTNFAKTGNPTPDPSVVKWLPTTKEQYNFFLIQKEQYMFTPQREEIMYKFWNTIYESYYNMRHCKQYGREEL